MKRKLLDRLRGPDSEQYAALLCLTVCFAVGAVGGCVFAGLMEADTQSRLLDYFSEYFAAVQGNTLIRPSLLSTVWDLIRWPLFTFLLGFTALGVVGLPVAFCFRGFLLSYAVAVLVRLYGSAGLLTALVVFGISGFLVLPALFTLGVDAFRNAGALVGNLLGEGKRTYPLGQQRLLRAGGCCVLLGVAIVFQFRLTPILLEATIGLMG